MRVVNGLRQAGRPFFLSLHFNAPHWPWEPGDKAESTRLAAGRKSPFDYDGGSMQAYAAMVRRWIPDRPSARRSKTGRRDNTIVIFTSDNGGERYTDSWPFTGMKMELLEGGLRIPAIVRWPARMPAGATTEQ